MTVADSVGSQLPTFSSVPPYVSSRGPEVIEFAEGLGLELDPWQRDLLTGALGLRDDGRWSAPDVGLLLARQNGKSEVALVRILGGLFVFGEDLVVYSAHQTKTSVEMFRRLTWLIRDNDLGGVKVFRGHGEESVELVESGQRVLFQVRSTQGGGRGFSASAQIFDEGQILPESSHASMLPALSARPMNQVWTLGTAVDERVHPHGLVFARARERGHRGEDLIAWYEWSLGDLADVDAKLAADPDSWAGTNPAYGLRITEETIRRELAAMDHRSFCAERLGAGDWPDTSLTGGRVISAEAWTALFDPESKMPTRMALGFDVSPDRSRGAVAAAGLRKDGTVHVEVIDHRRGADWIPDRILELAGRHRPAAIVADGRGPAGSLLAKLDRCSPQVTPVTAQEYAQGCAGLFDAVSTGKLAHLGDPSLEAAVAGAVKRQISDAWAWSRKNSFVDISPLCAVTLAAWGASQRRSSKVLWSAVDVFRAPTAEELEVERRQAATTIAGVAQMLGTTTEELLADE